ncbi:hypothetical protein TOT_040000065 [Theileria orientalis strain Shintoku]|uniref:Uncharacterized protein n=1 Tax=Theileria orientalis strain Shintoku TaxID=869250 RepID=J4DQ19_THEOR|nr:hypothetical protein TOT_040000065 [Theileria orientalis strain Shintoku]BAM41684.1 hypothetical protein TOT_040000065 [Theileria orientalis strain Shintoku]|eukprot:XP_009691985.1 hypothetical protein TOT_040000065 [Theileria orientalis strain Shintoku]
MSLASTGSKIPKFSGKNKEKSKKYLNCIRFDYMCKQFMSFIKNSKNVCLTVPPPV